MRAAVCLFLTLPTKSIWGSLIYKKTSREKVVHICTKECFLKFKIISMRNTGVMDY